MSADDQLIDPAGTGFGTGSGAGASDGEIGARRVPLGVNYRKLLAASTMTNLGDGLMTVAVVWLASSVTRDATSIALVGLMSRLPWLVFSLPAGVITDRFDRRVLVASMDMVRLAVVAMFAVVVAVYGSGLPTPRALADGMQAPDSAGLMLALLCAAALAIGFAEVIRDNAAQTLMPSIVDRTRLEAANGRLWAAETTMNNFVGPPLGGVLIAVALAAPFVVNAALLGVSALLIFSLAGTFSPTSTPMSTSTAVTARRSWRADLREGFGWLWRHPLLRTLALLLGVMNLLSSMAFVVVVLYAQEILGLFDGWRFGLALTGTAAGSVVGALVAERITDRFSTGTALLGSIVGMGTSTVAIGLAGSAWQFWAVSVVAGVMIVLWNVITVSLRQRIIPDHLLGRVNSVYRFFGWGTISIGTLLGGVLVTVGEPVLGREWALRAPFLLAGAAHLVVLAVAVPRLNTARIDDAMAAAEGATAEVPIDENDGIGSDGLESGRP